MFFLILWWQAVVWFYSSAWIRPFDDAKNTFLYAGAGIFTLGLTWKNKNPPSLKQSSFLLGYLLLTGATLLFSSGPVYEGMLAWMRLILWFSLAWVFSQLRREQWLAVAKWSVASAFAVGLLNIFETQGIPIPFLKRFADGDASWIEPIGQLTYYSDFMALNIPLAMIALTFSKNRWGKWGWGIALAGIVTNLWLAGSRTSIIATFLAALLILILLLSLGKIKPKHVFICGALFFASLVFSLFLNPYRGEPTWKRFASIIQKGDFGGRTVPFKITGEMIREKPMLGWGLGSFRFVYPGFARGQIGAHSNYARSFIHPHNEILHQWGETGFIGLLLLSIFLMTIFWKTSRWLLQRRASPVAEISWGLVGISGCTIAFISWQCSTNFLFPISRLFVAFYLGILWKHIAPISTENAARGIKYAFFIFVAVATAIVGAHSLSSFAVTQSYLRPNFQEREFWTTLAYKSAPGSFEPLMNYANWQLYNNDLNRARPALEKLLRHFPYVPPVLYYNAQGKLADGKIEEAKLLLEKAVALDPTFGVAENLLQNLKNR